MSSGFAATRIEPIAREAGVSTATLYGYYPSKNDLFAAVIEDATDDFASRMALVHDAGGDARERLTSFTLAYAEFMGDPFIRSVFRLVMAERPRFRDTAMAFFERGRQLFGRPLMETLAALDAAGDLSIAKPAWAAGQLMGMVEHPIFFMPLVTGDEVMPERGIEQIVADAVETFLARYARR